MVTDPDELRTLRRQNRLAVERIRAAKLNRVEQLISRRSLVESISLDWVTPYADMLDMGRRSGDPVFAGPTGYWQRSYGKNWPIFQTEAELRLLRAPARLLCATNDDAIGLINGISAYVVGSGYTYRPARRQKRSGLPDDVLEALQRVVDEILEANEWGGGEQPSIEAEAFWRSLEDGEFILVGYPQDDGLTQFRFHESDALTQPPGESDYDWWFGVCTERGDPSKPLSYWIQEGDSPSEGREYSPDEVCHLKRNGRRSQKRGVTDFAFDMYEKLRYASMLRLGLTDTAVHQASIPYVMQHDTGDRDTIQAFRDEESDFTFNDPLNGTQQNIRRVRRGEGLDVPKGQMYVEGPGAPYADKHLAILDSCLRGAVSRWNGFEWLISANAGNNNLPVDLSAESPFVRRVLQEQNRYTGAFKKPVWLAVEHYVRTNGLVVGGRSYSWEEISREVDLLVEAPSPETRNRQQESERGIAEIAAGLDSPQQFMQRQGRDPDQVEADNEAWAKSHQNDKPPDAKLGKPEAVAESLLESLGYVPDEVYRALLEGSDARRGLVQKDVQVRRDGKTFTQKRWVKAAKPKAGRKKGKVNRSSGRAPGILADQPDEDAIKTAAKWVSQSPNLSEDKQNLYANRMARVLTTMPANARAVAEEAISRGGAVFHPTLKALLTAAKAITGKSESRTVGFTRPRGRGVEIHLDNDSAAPGTYAHELWHAVDADGRFSDQPAWQKAYKQDILGGKVYLSRQALISPREGFAEIGRVLQVCGLEEMEADYPACVKFLKGKGLI